MQANQDDMTAAAPPSGGRRGVDRGESIYCAGEVGGAWRIVSGSVRLDRGDGNFAGLSLAGDVIGAETLLFGAYTYTAQALSGCVIEPWGEPAAERFGDAMLRLLAAAERRMADILAVRNGKAEARVGGLLALLGAAGSTFKLPRLRDIADITGLTIETVSRTIHALDEDGALAVEGHRQQRQIGVSGLPAGRALRGRC